VSTATTEQTFEQDVLARSHEKPIVVDFWADWCGPCHRLAPIIEQAVEETAGAVELVKVDVDANPTLAANYSVRGIPAVKAFRDGRVVDEFVGVLPHSELSAFVGRLSGPSPREALIVSLREETDFPQVLAALEGAQDEQALELLLAEAESSEGERRDRVRELMLRLFDALGTEDPLTLRYRRRLAALLF
jgi:putative thioredoxin